MYKNIIIRYLCLIIAKKRLKRTQKKKNHHQFKQMYYSLNLANGDMRLRNKNICN